MDVPHDLAADLADLTANLDPPADLEALLHAFGAKASAAVPSFVGLTITLFADGLPFTFTVRQRTTGTDTAATSLVLPLSTTGPREERGSLVLHASTPGAFVDLAADLSAALGVAIGTLDTFVTVGTDRHALPIDDGRNTGLAAIAEVNQAIGVLVARGRTLAEARVELRALAARAGTGVAEQAALVLRTVESGPPVRPG